MLARFESAKGEVRLASVIIDADESTGKAKSIERLELRVRQD